MLTRILKFLSLTSALECLAKTTPQSLYPLERKPVHTYPPKVAYYYIKYLRSNYISHVAAAYVTRCSLNRNLHLLYILLILL